jgi:hypothetical protein
MSGKTGRKPARKKPAASEREGAKADGAFGKEGLEQIRTSATTRNVDRSVERAVRRGGAGA